jgi:sarcosine oxidase subunit gamma
MSETTLIARSGFHGLLRPVGEGRGVVVTDRSELGLATVIASKGRAEALAAAVRERLGIELPDSPKRAASGDLSFIGTGPGTWFATHELGTAQLLSTLGTLEAVASISDQGDGHAVLRVSGSRVREALAKLVFIDLHPGAFAVGSAASTVAAHIGITLWRLADTPDGATFEVALYRSFAGSIWHALSESAAEFGLGVGEPP